VVDENDKYGRKPNIWRKVYGYNRRKPRRIAFVDVETNTTKSIDLNKTYRHRDFFKVSDTRQNEPLFIPEFQYEEGLIYFNAQTRRNVPFAEPFRSEPVLTVYTIDSASMSQSNVNVYGYDPPSQKRMFVETSAPFTGYVRYRSFFAKNLAMYHAVSASMAFVISPYTASFSIYGGVITTTNATDYTASYTMPPGALEYRATVHDVRDDNSGNVDLATTIVGAGSSTSTISAPLTNVIHFIVTKP